MNFDDVTVTLIERGSLPTRPSAGPSQVAGSVRANLDAVRDRVRELRAQRDEARARISSLEQELRAARVDHDVTLSELQQGCERELSVARALLEAGEQHSQSVEVRLVQTRRELLRERAATQTLREHLQRRVR